MTLKDNTMANLNPLRSKTGQAIHAEYFEDEGNWVVTNGVGVAETSLVRYYDAVKESLKVTGNNDTATYTYITKTLAANVDLRDTVAELCFYCPDVSNLTVTRLEVEDVNNNRVAMSIDWNNPPIYLYDGWYMLRFNPYDAYELDGVDADLILWQVRFLRLFNYKVANTDHYMVYDMLRFVPQQDASQVVISFDDGLDTDAVMADYLASRGIRATFFVCGHNIGEPGKLTLSQLSQLKQQGHLIANYNWSHGYLAMDSLTPSEAIAEIEQNAEWLQANGFSRGSRIWAIPGGTRELLDWGSAVNLLDPYTDFVRLTGRYSTATRAEIQPYPVTMGYAGPFDTPAGCEADLDEGALDGKGYFPFGFHTSHANVVSGGEVTAAFKSLIDAVVAKRDAGELTVNTYDELVYGQIQQISNNDLYGSGQNDLYGSGANQLY